MLHFKTKLLHENVLSAVISVKFLFDLLLQKMYLMKNRAKTTMEELLEELIRSVAIQLKINH